MQNTVVDCTWDLWLIPEPCWDLWKSTIPNSSLYVSYILWKKPYHNSYYLQTLWACRTKNDKFVSWRNNVYNTRVRTGCELASYPGSRWAHKESGYTARCECEPCTSEVVDVSSPELHDFNHVFSILFSGYFSELQPRSCLWLVRTGMKLVIVSYPGPVYGAELLSWYVYLRMWNN